MKLKHIKSEYRVLAIAVLFFGTGLLFWFTEGPHGAPPAPAKTVVVGAAPSSSALQNDVQNTPEFAAMPAPGEFRKFTLDGGEIDGAHSLTVTSTCADAYVAVLAFPAGVDYRNDIDRAVYNSAFPCAAPGDVITATITAASLGHVPTGTYYYFTADQGTSTMWYNPK